MKFFGIIVALAAFVIVIALTLGDWLNELLPYLDLRWFVAAAGFAGLAALVAVGFALVDRWDRARQKSAAKR
jgi:uncharacterized PurR-regulated membrane protein YhhQ (DUF165 family)